MLYLKHPVYIILFELYDTRSNQFALKSTLTDTFTLFILCGNNLSHRINDPSKYLFLKFDKPVHES